MKHTFLIASTTLVLACGCSEKQETALRNTKNFCLNAQLKEKIEIETVKKQAVAENLSLTGNITYNTDDVVQFSSLVGGLITNTYFSLGDYVKKGDVLAEIKSTELNSLQAERKSLEAQLQVAKRQLQSAQSMFDDGIASQSELVQANSQVNVLKSSLENVEQNLSLYSASSEKSVFQIKAPVTGYIVTKNVSPGMQIAANDAPLFTISNLSKVWVMVNVYPANLKDIHEGMEVNITTPAYPNQTFTGKITVISQVFDAEEHVLKARIVMNNTDLKLKPGLTADILINKKNNNTNMAAVSAQALIFDNNQNYIMVYNDDCHIERRQITPTVKNRDFLYFENGLNEGEKVIVKNHLLIYEQLKATN